VSHLYFSEQPGPYQPGQNVSLSADEAHHASTVARLGRGETTLVSDGDGTCATARVSEITPGRVTLEVLESEFQEPSQPELWLVQALAKGDRDETAIQMACELGVDRVFPFQAARSISVWRGDKVAKGHARWVKIVTEASKQSLRARIPEVVELATLGTLVELATECELVVLDPDADNRLSDFTPQGTKPVVIVVGPEGGLDPREVQTLVGAGAVALKLGDTVLRTSSAGPAALAVMNVVVGRW